MRIVNFHVEGQSLVGIVDGDDVVEFDDGSGLSGLIGRRPAELDAASGRRHALADITFLPPVAAGAKILCVGLNYAKVHPVTGLSTERPPQPTIFMKTAEALVGHRQPIAFPQGLSDQLDYEGELVVVIGRGGRHIAEADAYAHLAGYTVMNEGSVRDWQKNSLFSGKNFFASGGCGPWIVTADEVADPMALRLVSRLNGDEVQSCMTGEMLYSIPQIVSHISRFMPLSPGDMIATGSPDGSGGSRQPQRFLRKGDVIEVEIGGIGTLSNVVA